LPVLLVFIFIRIDRIDLPVMSGVVFLDIVRHVVNDASSAACHDRLSEMEWKQVASKVVIKSQVPLFVFAAVNVNEQKHV